MSLRAIAAAALALSACDDSGSSCEVSTAQAAITNGTARANYLALEPREEASVVDVTFGFAADASPDQDCSGVLVAEAVVLTAKHCARGLPPLRIQVRIETGGEAALSLFSEASIVAEHYELDLMVLLLEEPPDLSAVAPLPLAQMLPVGLRIGDLVQVAGFGESAEGAIGQRAFLVEELLGIDDRELIVGADGLGGACFGDSGGPLLARADDGSARTLGILGSGAPNCYGEDRYTRVDVVSDWIATVAGVDVTVPTADVRAEFGTDGRCFGETSIWVEQELSAVVCGISEPCGWSEAERGFRCTSASLDPCRGVDDVGACDGGDAVRCVGGTLQRNPCGSCGFECARSPMTGRPICIEG